MKTIDIYRLPKTWQKKIYDYIDIFDDDFPKYLTVGTFTVLCWSKDLPVCIFSK